MTRVLRIETSLTAQYCLLLSFLIILPTFGLGTVRGVCAEAIIVLLFPAAGDGVEEALDKPSECVEGSLAVVCRCDEARILSAHKQARSSTERTNAPESRYAVNP